VGIRISTGHCPIITASQGCSYLSIRPRLRGRPWKLGSQLSSRFMGRLFGSGVWRSKATDESPADDAAGVRTALAAAGAATVLTGVLMDGVSWVC
jgi:hypothetical protein